MQLSYSHYLNATGYSVCAQDYILAMLQSDRDDFDIKVNFLNASTNVGVSKNRQQLFQSLKNKKVQEPQCSVFHSIPHLYKRVQTAQKHIGFCIFETINPPAKWVEKMNEMDEIITASEFNENVFKENGVIKPIKVIPHCFDPNLFNKDVKPLGRYAKTTFLSVGTWKNRKNWEALIKAFYDAFENKNNVCLLIKTDNVESLHRMVTRIKRTCEWRSKNTAPIYAEETPRCSFEEIPRIMAKGDIYINASLGEGFCIPGMHAMAMGLPLITTRFGGSLEYAKPELCTYIEPSGYKTYNVMDGIPQFQKCIWPVIKIGSIRDAMLEVYKNYPTDKRNAAYVYAHSNFTYKAIGPQFIEAVKI